MAKPVIEVENISKLYHIDEIRAPTFHESIENWWNRLRGREEHCHRIGAKKPSISPDDPQAGPEPNTIWALKDISFSVNEGEIIGIIGRNGAGKSTLLKILTRITEPTKGRAIIRGRISSLLEVGTGFHPALTGRENVYLNGAILGMRKWEINKKFDEIVAFAEIEKFIDTPVKWYSSGMYVRLAFAIAAHLEPEVLLVDEVIAVGDVYFQKKCLGKMGQVAMEGRTVLFVSHNMQGLLKLCEKAVLLKEGRMAVYTDTFSVIQEYLKEVSAPSAVRDITPDMHWTYSPALEIFRVEILNRKGEPANAILTGEDFSLRIFYTINKPELGYRIGVAIRSIDGVLLASTISIDSGAPHFKGEKNCKYFVDIHCENIFLSGNYIITIRVKNENNMPVDILDGIPFSVSAVAMDGSFAQNGGGMVRLNTTWSEPQPKR